MKRQGIYSITYGNNRIRLLSLLTFESWNIYSLDSYTFQIGPGIRPHDKIYKLNESLSKSFWIDK